jgi:hypothetical protein
MILTEWNMEDAIAFAREEAREDGREEGREEEREERDRYFLDLLKSGKSPEQIIKDYENSKQ